MSSQFHTEFLNVQVSEHALQRFRERTGAKGGDEKLVRRLRNQLARAIEMEIRPEFRLTQLLNHCGRAARYFWRNPLFFIVEGNVLKTVHTGNADRWEVKA